VNQQYPDNLEAWVESTTEGLHRWGFPELSEAPAQNVDALV
jgi:hypothetical protein